MLGLAALKAAGSARVQGGVTVIPLGGDYSRGLPSPRAAVGRAFYQRHPDDYDFLFVFTTFEFPTGGALAFYNEIRNDVEGIGRPIRDVGQEFGSAARLQGYIDMGAMSRYAFNARDAGFAATLNTLAHEVMHRWGVYVSYRDGEGVHRDLLGESTAHWSALAQSEASIMYGARWDETSPGNFRVGEARVRLGLWDLYLAGMADPAELPPLRLIRGAALDPSTVPGVGLEASGVEQAITIDQVVAAEGPRRPAADRAPRRFTAAIVLLTRPGEEVDPGHLAQLERLRSAFESYFQSITRGRASIAVVHADDAVAGAMAAPPILAGSPSPAPGTPLASAAAWLKAEQHADGRWEDRPGTALRDTALALRALAQIEPDYPGLAAARQYLDTREPRNADEAGWRALARGRAESSDLAAWGLEGHRLAVLAGWEPAAMDIALVAQVNAEAPVLGATRALTLSDHLMALQRHDGSFAALDGGRVSLRTTVWSTRALAAAPLPQHAERGRQGRNWLAARVDRMVTDFGVAESADVLLHAPSLGMSDVDRGVLLARLLPRQGRAGDWAGSVSTTATMALALATQQQPNYVLSLPDLEPRTPRLGQPFEARVRIANGGGHTAPATVLQWHRNGLPEDGGTTTGPAYPVPALLPGESLIARVPLESEHVGGALRLVAAIDPADEVPETREDDNRAEIELSVAPRHAGPDPAVFNRDLTLAPERFSGLGQRIRLSGWIRNLGEAPASGLLVRLDRAQATGRMALGEARVDLPGAGRSEFEIEFVVADLGTHALELVVDPDDALTEADELNNRVALELGFDSAVDLHVGEDGLTVLPAQPVLGDDLRISLRAHNAGTRASGLTEVVLEREAAEGWERLASLPLEVPAGAWVDRDFLWRPEREGLHRLRAVIDPEGRVAELDTRNNEAHIDLQVGSGEAVNLVVEPASITLVPAPALEGRGLAVSATVRNLGLLSSGPFNLAVYLGDPRHGGIRLAAERIEDGLPGSGSALRSLQVDDLPASGDVTLFVFVDSELEVFESNELDNFGIHETISLRLPDLAVSAGALRLDPAAPVPGLPVRLEVDVSNLGEQASEQAPVRLEQRAGQQRSVVSVEQAVPPLEPGASHTLRWEWIFGEGINAESLVVSVDPENRLREHREDNNEATLLLRAQSAAAFVSEPYFSPNGDGVRDRTTAWFADAAGIVVSVEVHDAEGRHVADLGPPDSVQGDYRGATWSGQDRRGGVAPDGRYRLVALDGSGHALAIVEAVLDVDRPAALYAVHTDRALRRALPASTEPWQRAAEGTEGDEYLFAQGVPGNAQESRRRGILRTHVLMGGVEFALSPRWLDRHARSQQLESADVVTLGVGGERGRLHVLLREARSGFAPVITLWVQDALAADRPRRVAELPGEAESWRVLGFLRGERVLLGLPEAGRARWLADIATGALTRLREPLPGQSVLRVYDEGVVLGRWDPNGMPEPSIFVPADPAAEPIEVDIDWATPDGEVLCHQSTSFHPSRPLLLAHRQGEASDERVELLDLASGHSRILAEAPLAGACQPSIWSPSKRQGKDSSRGSLRLPAGSTVLALDAHWQRGQERLWIIDHLEGLATAHNLRGERLKVRSLASTARRGPYAATDSARPGETFKGRALQRDVSCDAAGSSGKAGGLSNGTGRYAYDLAAERLYLEHPESVLVELIGGDQPVQCRGVIEHRVHGLQGEDDLLGAQSLWPLADSFDRSRYPLEALGAPATLPESWPRLIQRDGTTLQHDARIRKARGVLTRPWAEAAAVIADWDSGTRIDLGSNDDLSRVNAVFSTLDRMSAVLRAGSDGRAVRLSGLAMDGNFDHFRIDYAPADRPEDWRVLIPATADEVYFDDFITWAPPEPGAYLFRLVVVDKAGNTLRRHASAEVQFSSPITALRQDHRSISPNGDGVQDALNLDFIVTRPTEQRFRVVDSAARVVYEEDRSFGVSELGANAWRWNGRDQAGAAVAEGAYRVELSSGFQLRVTVDRTPPQLLATQRPSYPPHALGGTYWSEDRVGAERSPPSALRLRLERRALDESSWQFWKSLEVPGTDGSRDEQRIWGLTAAQHFTHQYRIVAEDVAGNRTIREFATPQPVFALANVQPNSSDRIANAQLPAEWQPTPFDLLAPYLPRLSYLPRLIGGQSRTPIAVVVAPDAPARLSLISNASQIAEPVAIEYRLVPTTTSTEWRVLQHSVAAQVAPHEYQLDADLEDFAGRSMELRLAYRDESARRVTSNGFRLRIGGAALGCIDERGRLEASVRLLAPLGSPALRPMRAGMPGPLVLTPRSAHEQDAETGLTVFGFQLPEAIQPAAGEAMTFLFDIEHGSGRRFQKVLSAGLCAAGILPPGGTAPDGLILQIAPVFAESCSEGPTGQAEVVVRQAAVGARYRLLLHDPRQLQPVVISEGAVGQAGRIETRFSTDGLPEGEARITLELERDGALVVAREATFPVDRTPPVATLRWPSQGMKVCANHDGRVPIEADLFSDSALEYRVELAQGAGPEATGALLGHSLCEQASGRACQVQTDVLGAPATWDQPFPLPRIRPNDSSSSQAVTSLLPRDVFEDSGEVTVRLLVTDWSGAAACRASSFSVDLQARFSERQPPGPRIAGAQNPDQVAVSTRPDARHSTALWYFHAAEPLAVHAELFRARREGSWALTGEPLLIVHSGAVAPGPLTVRWDASGLDIEDGDYGVEFVATDDCGNTHRVIHFLTLDSTPPAVAILSPADGAALRTAAIEVRGLAEDPHFAEYRLSLASAAEGPWTELASDSIRAAAGRVLLQWPTMGRTGVFWLRLQAFDQLGHVSEQQVSFSLLERPVVLDGARLRPTLFSPNGDGRLDRVGVEVSLRRAARLSVEVWNADGQRVATPLSETVRPAGSAQIDWDGVTNGAPVGEGEYQVRVRAVDAELAENIDEASLELVVDLSPPLISATEPAHGSHARCDGSAGFAVDDPHLAEYDATLRADGGAMLGSAAGRQSADVLLRTLEGLQGGPYAMRIQALDSAGNAAEAFSRFELDCTPPEIGLDAPEESLVVPRGEGRATRLEGRATDAHLAEWRLLLAPAGQPSMRSELARGEQPVAGLLHHWRPEVPDGDYLLVLEARDRAGNRVEDVRPIRVDGTPPLAVIAAPAEGALLDGALQVLGSANDANFLGYEVALASPADAAAGHWSPVHRGDAAVNDGELLSLQLDHQGAIHLRLRVEDRAGWSTSVETRFVIDTVPPPAPVALVARVENRTHVRLNWQGGDADDLAGFHVMRGEDLITDTPVPLRTLLDLDLPEGEWTYRVAAVDHAGNLSAPSSPATARIDRTAPEVELIAPRHDERLRGEVDILGTAFSVDDFDGFELQLIDSIGNVEVLRSDRVPVRQGVLHRWDTRPHAEGARFTLRLSARDRHGNEAHDAVDITLDNRPPAAPQGLAAELRGADVQTTWTPNTEPDLLGYLLYRNGTLVTLPGDLPADLRPFAIAENRHLDIAPPDGALHYVVYAVDQAGNVSPPSAPASVTRDHGPPHVEIVRPSAELVFESAIEVLAHSDERDIASVQFGWRAAGAAGFTPLGAAVTQPPWRSTFDPDVLPFGEYEITAVATDLGARVDPAPDVVRVRYADLTPPRIPSGLVATADADLVRLQWQPNIEEDLAGYRVERLLAGGLWQRVDGGAVADPAWQDPERATGTHEYRVIAVDQSGNASEPSAPAVAHVFDVTVHPPRSPVAVSELVLEGEGGRRGGVAHLRLQGPGGTRELAPGHVDSGTAFRFEGLPLDPGATRIGLRVEDAEGNRSLPAQTTLTRGLRPQPPSGLDGRVEGLNVQLHWDASAAEDVVGYVVYRNDESLRPDQPITAWTAVSSGVPVPEVADGDDTTAWVTQSHGLGDRLEAHLEIQLPAPRLIGGLRLRWVDAARSARTFAVDGWFDGRWNTIGEVAEHAGADRMLHFADGYPTDRLRLRFSRTQGFGGTHALAGLTWLERMADPDRVVHDAPGQGAHRYQVAAISALGFEGERTAVWVAEVGDADAPAPVVLSGRLEGRDALLEWSASDAPDALAYRLYRNGLRVAELAVDAPRQFRDPALANGEHRYLVRVVDQVGNQSAPSNEVVLVTEGALPGTPRMLRVVAQQGEPALQVEWQPGGGAPPTAYQLYHSHELDGVGDPYRLLVRQSTTQFVHRGLQYGERVYYKVRAEDAFGNLSEFSPPMAGVAHNLDALAPPLLAWPTIATQPAALDASPFDACGLATPGTSIELLGDAQLLPQRAATEAEAAVRELWQDAPVVERILLPDASAVVTTFDYSGRFELLDGSGDTIREPALDGGWSELQLSHHGDRLYGLLWGGIVGMDLASRDTLGIWTGVHSLRRFALDLQQQRVLVVGTGPEGFGLHLHDRDSGTTLPIAFDDAGGIVQIAWEATGRHAWIRHNAGGLLRFSVEGLELEPVEPDGVRRAFSVSSAEDAVAYVRESGAADEVVLIRGGVESIVASGADPVLALDWFRDGSLLALLRPGRIEVIELATGGLRDALEVPGVEPGGRWRLQFSPAGQLLVHEPAGWGGGWVIDLAGRFCVRGIDLSNSPLALSALAVSPDGVRSPRSAAIVLSRRTPSGPLPDLAIEPADVRFLPAAGEPGQEYTGIVTVRNRGEPETFLAEARVTLLDASGRVLGPSSLHHVGELGPGAARSFSVRLGRLDQVGEYWLQVELDPEDRVPESDERNNLAVGRLLVSARASAQLGLRVERGVAGPGEPMAGEVVVEGTGGFSGRLRVRVLDAEGTVVANLQQDAVGPLSFGAADRRHWMWSPTAEVLAGDYRVEAVLFDLAGGQVDSRSAPLRIEDHFDLRMSLQPARPVAVASESLPVQFGVDLLTANRPIADGRLTLLAIDTRGDELLLWDRPTGVLLAGYALRRSVALDAARFAEGDLQLRLRFAATGIDRVVERSVVIAASGPATGLTGDIRITPQPRIPLGLPAPRLTFEVRNGGGTSETVEARLRLYREGASEALRDLVDSAALAPQGSLSGETLLAGLPERTEAYVAVLEARVEGSDWQRLAQRGLSSVDVLPPQIHAVLPGHTRPQRPPVRIGAEIVDLHSRVGSAQYRLNGSEWRVLPSDGHAHETLVGGLADGEHVVALRAADIWGNVADTGARSFVVDGTPPRILIDGVSDGQHSREPLRPSVEIVDAHPDQHWVTLDGQPLASGEAVEAEGDYRLQVVAIDAAGNLASSELAFHIDRSAPDLRFVEPAPNSVFAHDRIAVRLETEPDARVALSVGVWRAEVHADALGVASFNAVPLDPGENTLNAVATDLAGNSSPIVSLTTRRVSAEGDLVGALALSQPSLPRGAEVSVAVSISNGFDEPLSGLPVRLRWIDAAGVRLASWSEPLSIGAGAGIQRSIEFATQSWPLGSAVVELGVHYEGEWQVLATAALTVLDAAPPVLDWLAPQGGSLLRPPAALRLRAGDDDRVVAVEVRAGDGPWLPLGAAGGEMWEGLVDLPDGAHTLRARARDASGNQTEAGPLSIEIDGTAPRIVVSGVAADGLYPEPVVVTFDAVDANPGRLVAHLDGQPFASGSRIERTGRYRLEIEAEDALGHLSRTEVRFELDLEPPTLSFVEPLEGATLPGASTPVHGLSRPLARVQLEGALSTHTVDADVAGRWWIDAVDLVEGANLLRASATDRFGRRSAEVTLGLVHDPALAAGLHGGLVVRPDPLPAGLGLDIDWSIREVAGQARAGLPVRLRILQADRSSGLAARQDVITLEPHASRSQVERFESSDWPLGPLRAELEVDLGNGWVALAASAFSVVDRTPPQLAFVQPAAGSFHRSDVEVLVEASDLHGGVNRVEVQVGASPWSPLADRGQGDRHWGGSVLPGAQGSTVLRARAADTAGNVSAPTVLNIQFDSIAPDIRVAGITDGELRNTPARLEVHVEDASPVQTSIELNGTGVANGTEVSADGPHALWIESIDAAGNRAERTLRFEIDRTPPELRFALPAQAAVLRSATTDVIGQTEPGARIRFSAGSFALELTADAQGGFRIADVPLAQGENLLRAQATDRAGNEGPWVERTLERRGSGGLRGALEAPANAPTDAPLRIDVRLDSDYDESLALDLVRVEAVLPDARRLPLDLRRVTLEPRGSQGWTLQVATAGWPEGRLLLRLSASIDDGAQLASRIVVVERGTQGPAPTPPRVVPIPISGRTGWALLLLALSWSAVAALRRRKRIHG